jgi:ubiquitin carboxyl-terminal hydrolase 4/11
MFTNSNWNFANLGTNSRGDQMISGTGSDVEDGASDVVQHNSSAGVSDVTKRMQDFADTDAVDKDGNFINRSSVLDLDEGQAAILL